MKKTNHFWQHFLANGQERPTPVCLGLEGYGVDDRDSAGVLVRSIQQGSPAEEAGILEGDILLEVDERRVTSADELFRCLEALDRELPLSVTLLRDGRRLERLLVFQQPAAKRKQRGRR